MTQRMTRPQSTSATEVGTSHGYSPDDPMPPFTAFNTVTPKTSLESLNLNWREKDLPERTRTKHVHRLHPYLGKFVPQLAEVFLRKFEPMTFCDPFCGSGTALVEAAALGINAVGCDISSFNGLMTRVKMGKYNLEQLEFEIGDILGRATSSPQMRLLEEKPTYLTSEYLKSWFARSALESLIAYRELIKDYEYSDVLRLILSRSARSARLTTHFDLDFPKEPQTEPYYCYKHRRTCKPTENAAQFLKRYSRDTLNRIREFSAIRKDVTVSIITGDSRIANFPSCDFVITSPPYVGLIDYHAQHRYSYELLGLDWNAESEIGAAQSGSSLRAQANYVESMVESFKNVKNSLSSNGRMVVIVNDKYGLYEEIQERVEVELETRLERHVNRRTGRRAGDFFESVFVWKRKGE